MNKTSKPLTPGEVLEVALAKERSAYRFYENIENRLRSTDFLLDLVTKLKNEEAKHIRLIQDEMAKMNQ